MMSNCPSCKYAISPEMYFCPNCGKKLKEKPLTTTISKQIAVYFISLFVPPFGLWYVYKYLKQKDSKSRIVGIVAFILTIIAVWITIYAMASVTGFVNSFVTQQLTVPDYGF